MSILQAEPDIFPANLWDQTPAAAAAAAAVADAAAERWFCLHTKPRQEKATARRLHASQTAFYLPQAVHESRTPAGRKIRSIQPLFHSYVFMRGTDHQRVQALRGNTLVRVIEVADQAALRSELSQIHRMLTSGLTVRSEPPHHPVGGRIKIINGPLAGLVGTVLRRGARDRFIASVSFLGLGGSVDLEDWQVERIDPPA